MDAQTIADKIISSVSRWGLNMGNLVGQGYDGAATLSPSKNDLGKAHNDVHVSKEAIANARKRNETTWNKVWGRIESIAEAPDITITQPRTVIIQRHRSNAGHNQTLWIDVQKLIMQLAQHGKVIWSPESHIYATIEADKTFYLYLIQKFYFYFIHKKSSNKSQQKTFFWHIS